MLNAEKILIGGRALVALGSSRTTQDTDYLINDPSSDLFVHDGDTDYINAARHNFFNEIWNAEKNNQIASPQSLLELKAFSFVQHCQNFNFQKADDAEYDMKFLVRKFNLEGVKVVNKYVTSGELSEIKKVIESTRK